MMCQFPISNTSATHGEATILALTQHPMKWKEYESLSSEDKQFFFVKNESAELINMRSFIQSEGSLKARIIAKQKFKFIIDADIIEML